ncbi:hybrid sensor histidine kinase/response regulator [Chroococcus sp. FPU101]|uniref:hybrid sensor histidine kinase/response regulator n=1 Tax=Chroococcus sp. FPU101 TaxID=1974212 RepID=UPI001A8ECE02|nr:hybrid sensor histidine kinase/response regulator [Chroococcus sp. FPU101]GFE67395.1 putative CheA signal transduction histidine kinase [Chroococcus sp. FPU101]
MMSHESDHSFNEEFAKFFNEIEEENQFSGNDVLDDFESLFGQNFPSDESRLTQRHPTHSSRSASPTEIQDLFGADFSWEEATAMSPQQQHLETRSLNDDDWDELEQLLSTQPTPQKLIEEDQPAPSLYLALEDLDYLINQPAALTAPENDQAAVFNRLEALISQTVIHAQTEPTLDLEEVDDEFKDLEKLLEATNQNLIGSSNSSNAAGQWLQPRSRTPKVKIFEQTMRVPIKQLDNLSNLIGELVVKRNRLEDDQERLRNFLDNLLNQVQSLSDIGGRMQDLYERTLLEGALLASRHRSRQLTVSGGQFVSPTEASSNQDLDALEMDRFTGFHLLSQDIIELIVRIREASSDIQFVVDESEQVTRSLRQATTQLQESMTKSRMVPFAQIADRLPRAIRDISLKLNKQAKLQVEGRDVLIDKMILEHLNSPMAHLVNNAITHGIESPSVRLQAGKPAAGTITVRSFLHGNQTMIVVTDDGAGIDAEKVKEKAIKKGLITPEEAKIYTPQDVYELLFHPGFSTKDKADDFAGRGVGLDVVRTSLTEVRGTVSIDSVLGKGTTFTIRLPLTLTICKALYCLSNHARIAFSMDGVEEMKDFTAQDIYLNDEGQRCILWSGQLLPIQSLADLLSYNRQISRSSVYGGKPEDDHIAIVILRGGTNLLAVQVDQVLGEQEIVIKQIEGPIPKPPGIAGATVLGDGSVLPIGDVLELIEIAQGRLRTDSSSLWRKVNPPTEIEPKQESTVLIVDDSITVRELLSLSFSKAGYRVEQARDGQEAWEKLRSGLPCDIVFCDIEMPRMNGLELLSNLLKDEQLSHIPIAMLTSRGAERHRSVAAKLGASGYFTKPYTEKDLLDAAQRMINGEVLLTNSIKKEKSQVSRHSSSDKTVVMNWDKRKGNLVLIIDDSVMVREMLSMSFTKGGYQIEQARDGQEAWEKLQSGLPCDLILCDIEMPRMNGLELLSRLQENEKLFKIPIAMITSRGAQKMQNRAAELGAKGYFVKPYIEEVLLDAAKRLIAGEILLEKSDS